MDYSLQVLVLFLSLRALPRKSHSHFKMTGSIFVEIARIAIVWLKNERLPLLVYPVLFSIFHLIRITKRNIVIDLIFILKSRIVDSPEIVPIDGYANNTYKKLALDIQSRCDSSMNTSKITLDTIDSVYLSFSVTLAPLTYVEVFRHNYPTFACSIRSVYCHTSHIPASCEFICLNTV